MSSCKEYNLSGVSSQIELSKSGPRLKANSGALEARNSADSAMVVMRAANASAPNDLVAWGQLSAVNAQTGTSYTLQLTDAFQLVTLSNAAAIAVTVPTNASVPFPVGTRIDFIQLGAGRYRDGAKFWGNV